MRSSPMKISPLVTLSSPASIRKLVVFPHPEGPSNTTNSPSSISSERSSTTVSSPYRFITLSKRICIVTSGPSSLRLRSASLRFERPSGPDPFVQPFTLPSDNPLTRYRCIASAKTSIGIIATAPAALITPHLISYCVTRPAIPTGNVIAASVCVNTSANKNSFQQTIKQNTAVAASPGVTSGSTTRTSAPKRESPSTSAASSRSRGTSAKNPRIIQTTNGRLNPV